MCLLIVAPAGAGADLTDDQLKDFFKRNDDGYGFMFAEDGQLTVHKKLGTVEEFIADWRRLADKDRAVHLRMKTHGNIDLENCHPYMVVDNETTKIALMHNGILRTGNSKDHTKSDTWHFIKDYLTPILTAHPELMENQAFGDLLAETIGSSNKFVLLDNHGHSMTINHQAGIKWDDMWFSNTYAWTPPEAARPKYSGYQGSSRGRDYHSSVAATEGWDYEGGYYGYRGYNTRQLAGPHASVPTTTGQAAQSTGAEEGSKGTAEVDREAQGHHVLDSSLKADPKNIVGYVDSYRYWHAGQITLQEVAEYVDQLGADAAWELVELLTENSIDEEVFLDYVKNKKNPHINPPPPSADLQNVIMLHPTQETAKPVLATQPDESAYAERVITTDTAASSEHTPSTPLVTPETAVAAPQLPVPLNSGLQE